MEIRERIGSAFPGIFESTRQFIKKGELIKISARSGEHQPRTLFLVCLEKLQEESY